MFICMVGCQGTGQKKASQTVVLEQVTSQIIVGGLSEFYSETVTLKEKITAFIDNPNTTTLDDAKEAWIATQLAWEKTEPYQLGPVDVLRSESKLNYWPKDTSAIQTVIESTISFDEDFMNTVGASKKGLPVLEYLLFANSTDETLRLFTTDALNDRYKAYANSLATDITKQAGLLYDAWQPSKGNYSRTFLNDSSAMEMLVNQMIALAENMKAKKLGKPMGKQSGGNPNSREVESFESGKSFDNILANLDTLATLFNATYDADAYTLGDYLKAEEFDELQTNIFGRISFLQTEVNSLKNDTTLAQAIDNQDERLESLYDSVTELIRLLKVDLSTALNTTVHFNDTDGD